MYSKEKVLSIQNCNLRVAVISNKVNAVDYAVCSENNMSILYAQNKMYIKKNETE